MKLYLCLNVLVKWCYLNRPHDLRKWIRQMCLTSLMQPVFYAIQHPSQYINTILWEISYLWLVTMPFLIEYKSHFSWQLMPTVWGMQWKPLSHTRITAMMLQWFNDDNWYYSSKAVCGYRSHCFDCYKDNSKQHWDSCCAEMTNMSFTEQRQPLHPSNDSEF